MDKRVQELYVKMLGRTFQSYSKQRIYSHQEYSYACQILQFYHPPSGDVFNLEVRVRDKLTMYTYKHKAEYEP